MKNIEEKKDRRSLKGMTLLEVIIALVVLVIVSTMMAEAAVAVVYNLKTSKSVIEKVNYQSKYVYNKKADSYMKYDSDAKKSVETKFDKSTFSFQLASDEKGETPIGKSIDVVMYEAPKDDEAQYKNFDGAGNLKYFVHTKDAEDEEDD